MGALGTTAESSLLKEDAEETLVSSEVSELSAHPPSTPSNTPSSTPTRVSALGIAFFFTLSPQWSPSLNQFSLYSTWDVRVYVLDPGKKNDPVIRWSLPDRIFFGHGACHILAGVFLREAIQPKFAAFWIQPHKHPGAHVFVSDGQIAFDYHGYSSLKRLTAHHQRVWEFQYPGWSAATTLVDFDLLNTAELNKRNMRGADQYHGDPIARAKRFIDRIDHTRTSAKVRQLVKEDEPASS